MPTPISATFTLGYTPAFSASVIRQLLLSIQASIAGSNFKQESQTIPITAGGTAISVTGITLPRWCAIINRDLTNKVDIMTAVSGTAFATLLAGEGMLLPLAPGITAPAALAYVASCIIEVLILDT